MKKTIFALLAGFLAVGAAQAQTTADTGSHVYVGIGATSVKDRIKDEHKTRAKIFGGYEFNQNWAVEAGYQPFGSSSFYAGSFDSSQIDPVKVKSSALYLAGKYTVPVNEQFSAYGKFGLSYAEQKFSSPAAGWNFTDHKTGAYAGLGVQYKLTEKVSLLGEVEHHDSLRGSGSDKRVWSAGLKYNF